MNTRKGIYAVSVLVAVLLAVIIGCSFEDPASGSDQGTDLSGPPSFRVEEITVPVKSARSADRSVRDAEIPVIELWVMTVNAGNDEPIAHQNAYDIIEFSPDEEGGYEIPMESLPNDPFVVFIVETYADTSYNVLGFLSLNIDTETVLMTFPSPEEIIAPVNFGTVQLDPDGGYISLSEETLSQNEGAFDPETFSELHEHVVFHNTGQMALNVLLNTDPSTYDYYAVGLTMGYHTNLPFSPPTAADMDWNSYISINVYSNDETSNASLFTPSGENLNGDGNFPASQVGSATKFFVDVPMSTFKAGALPGEFWELRNDSGDVLARFDMSVAMLTDNDGYPIMPIMKPTYTLKTGTTDIDTVSFNWFYFLPDGTTRVDLDDISDLENLIGKQEFSIQANDVGETYMYREPEEDGGGAMEGDIATAHTFTPDFAESSFNTNVSAAYRFTLMGCSTEWGSDYED